VKACLPNYDASKMMEKEEFMFTIVEKLLPFMQNVDPTGKVVNDLIPDGFYLVGDSNNPQHEWTKAIIDSVRNITHITPPDADGTICGEPITQEGVFIVPSAKFNLCSSVSGA